MRIDAYISEIRLFAHDKVPDNFLPCDGRAVPISKYQALYACIGILHGGDGTSTFGLPDFRAVAPVGVGEELDLGNRAWLDTFNSVRRDGQGLDSIRTRAVTFCIAFDGTFPTERG